MFSRLSYTWSSCTPKKTTSVSVWYLYISKKVGTASSLRDSMFSADREDSKRESEPKYVRIDSYSKMTNLVNYWSRCCWLQLSGCDRSSGLSLGRCCWLSCHDWSGRLLSARVTNLDFFLRLLEAVDISRARYTLPEQEMWQGKTTPHNVTVQHCTVTDQLQGRMHLLRAPNCRASAPAYTFPPLSFQKPANLKKYYTEITVICAENEQKKNSPCLAMPGNTRQCLAMPATFERECSCVITDHPRLFWTFWTPAKLRRASLFFAGLPSITASVSLPNTCPV